MKDKKTISQLRLGRKKSQQHIALKPFVEKSESEARYWAGLQPLLSRPYKRSWQKEEQQREAEKATARHEEGFRNYASSYPNTSEPHRPAQKEHRRTTFRPFAQLSLLLSAGSNVDQTCSL